MSLNLESLWRSQRAASLAAAAFLFLAPAAYAQNPTTPAPAAPGSAAAPTAPAAEPSPSQLAAARQLVVVSGMSRSFQAAIPELMRRLTSSVAQTRPEASADLAIVLKGMQPDFAKDVDQMIDKAAHIYAGLLTESEIKAATVFFSSDAGKKYVQAEPIFFNKIINAMQDWHEQISSKMMAEVRAEMKKKGHPL